MAETATIKVRGLRELQRALKAIDRELAREIDGELRGIAQAVADDAKARFSTIDARSASGFRPRLRGFGKVVVEQRRKRTTGLHPEYGALQMTRALIPAMWGKRTDVEHALESMIDHLADRHGF